MGRPKHGANSARTKSSANYKSSGRRAINKAEKQKKLAEGKKIKSRKTPKTMDMIWDTMTRNLFYEYDPKDINQMPPKNVNKTCVR